jgi:lipoyl(octanoyl) transferase
MEARIAAIHDGTEPEAIWLVEHPPLYTRQAPARTIRTSSRRTAFPVFNDRAWRPIHLSRPRTARGLHHAGRAQTRRRCAPLRGRSRSNGSSIRSPGSTSPASGAKIGSASGSGGRTGAGAEDKIAAIGIRIRKGIAFHGISINVDPELEHFSGIVPCGVRDHGVTSLMDLGQIVSMAEVDSALRETFEAVFERTTEPLR